MSAQTNNPQELRVQAIKNGTVIDHLPAGNVLLIIKLLGGIPKDKIVTLGVNLKSKAYGQKDLIKIENRELNQDEVDRIALIAPKASINIIRAYKVIKKITPQLPEKFKNIITCPNPSCITNHERMQTLFKVLNKEHNLLLQCHYCEKQFPQTEIINYI